MIWRLNFLVTMARTVHSKSLLLSNDINLRLSDIFSSTPPSALLFSQRIFISDELSTGSEKSGSSAVCWVSKSSNRLLKLVKLLKFVTLFKSLVAPSGGLLKLFNGVLFDGDNRCTAVGFILNWLFDCWNCIDISNGDSSGGTDPCWLSGNNVISPPRIAGETLYWWFGEAEYWCVGAVYVPSFRTFCKGDRGSGFIICCSNIGGWRRSVWRQKIPNQTKWSK